MSAFDWIPCPKGCSEDNNFNTVRVDFEYALKVEYAFIRMRLECQVCGLLVKFDQKKEPKKVITELQYDKPEL